MGKWRELFSERKYSLYVLGMLLLTYLLNQVDRYTIAIVSKEAEKDIGFGDGAGGGTEYDLLAGPVFNLIYTFAGIPIGYLADRYNRKNILSFSLLFWSLSTAAMGLSRNYTELTLSRAGQGLGEAGCTPPANGIISEYFSPSTRGTALGVYNWGIYTGYSLAYGLGNYLQDEHGYRSVFIWFGLAGIPVSLLLFTSVKEPKRGVYDTKKQSSQRFTIKQVLLIFWKRKSLMLLCLAGAIRNAGGLVWANNTNLFFENYHGKTGNYIARYMSWIPLVGGSLGATFGGFISDYVVKDRGSWARIWVLIASQIISAPFAAGALILPTPWAFISLIPANIIGEMWVGVTLAVVAELVEPGMRVVAVAIYFFIISNVGSLAVLAVSPLRKAFGNDNDSWQPALLIMYPGLYVLASILFFFTLATLRKDLAAGVYGASGKSIMYEQADTTPDSDERPLLAADEMPSPINGDDYDDTV
jgi:MFS family permease